MGALISTSAESGIERQTQTAPSTHLRQKDAGVRELLRLQLSSSSRSRRALCTALPPPSLLKYA
jgi:hypothetical protein